MYQDVQPIEVFFAESNRRAAKPTSQIAPEKFQAIHTTIEYVSDDNMTCFMVCHCT